MNGWTANSSRYQLRIEQWPEGFYLFVFREGEAIPFRDDLQNGLANTMSVAAEDYGVLPSAWIEEVWSGSIR